MKPTVKSISIGILSPIVVTLVVLILGWFLYKTKALFLFIAYCLVQLFDNLITQFVIFGKSAESHPLEIFIIILTGGFLFGISGMILAIPVYTALKVISKEFLSEYKIMQRLKINL
ncbi:MAG: putative PurR-regulated permease PerM [Patiriisocius sp.]|jgi:predicted PurR-regulated permease PerM